MYIYKTILIFNNVIALYTEHIPRILLPILYLCAVTLAGKFEYHSPVTSLRRTERVLVTGISGPGQSQLRSPPTTAAWPVILVGSGDTC